MQYGQNYYPTLNYYKSSLFFSSFICCFQQSKTYLTEDALILMCHSKMHTENLMYNPTVSEGGVCRRWLGPKSSHLLNGIWTALSKCLHTASDAICPSVPLNTVGQSEASRPGPQILNLLASRTMKNNLYYLQITQDWAFCYSNTDYDRRAHWKYSISKVLLIFPINQRA